MTALGLDINPVVVEAVCMALGRWIAVAWGAFEDLSETVGRRICDLYQSVHPKDAPATSLTTSGMQACCPNCEEAVDLFPSYAIAQRTAGPQARDSTGLSAMRRCFPRRARQ